MSNKPKNQIQTIDQWVEEFTSHIASETMKILSLKDKDESLGRKVISSYLSHLVEHFVVKSMTTEKTPMRTERQADAAVAKFNEVKHCIQEAVASGYQGAMHELTGRYMEYYCTVKPVPLPLNQETH